MTQSGDLSDVPFTLCSSKLGAQIFLLPAWLVTMQWKSEKQARFVLSAKLGLVRASEKSHLRSPSARLIDARDVLANRMQGPYSKFPVSPSLTSCGAQVGSASRGANWGPCRCLRKLLIIRGLIWPPVPARWNLHGNVSSDLDLTHTGSEPYGTDHIFGGGGSAQKSLHVNIHTREIKTTTTKQQHIKHQR